VDARHIRTAYANACRLSLTPEEISIQFGVEERDDLLQREITVMLSHCIVLTPMTAKRLALVLRDAMAAPGMSIRGLMESISEGARLPIRLLTDLDARYVLGGSFKMSQHGLQGGRHLVTLAKPTLAEPRDEKILDLCRRLGMPTPLLNAFAARLPPANYVHLGFEDRGAEKHP
jgi:hypothetical protein